jgi:hypothetical protein
MERDTTMAPDSAPAPVDTFLQEQGTGVPADTAGYGGLERPDTTGGAAQPQPGADTTGYGQQPGQTGADTSGYGQQQPGQTGYDTTGYQQPGATGVDTAGQQSGQTGQDTSGMTGQSDTSQWHPDSTHN